MKDYDFYLFDWDGTIANTTEVWIQAMRANLVPYGLDLPRETLLKTMGDWRDLTKHGLPEDSVEAYHLKTGTEAQANLPAASLYEGAYELLKSLHDQNKKLAVVTASSRPTIEMMLKLHDLDQLFDVVVSGSDVKEHKPHPEGILLALERLGALERHRAIMLGDTTRDLLAAQAANIDHALFLPEDAHFELEDIITICKPMHVVRRWQDFAPHISR